MAEKEKWQVYFDRLTALARKKLRDIPKQLKDEQDIANSAIKSFFRGLERNGVPSSRDDFDLWPLLATIAARKCVDLLVYLKAKKRDVSKITDAELDEITCNEPGPGSVAEQQEGRRRLLDVLEDDRSRQIAEWKMEGFTHKEIAEKLDTSERAVEREVRAIKGRWEKHVDRIFDQAIAK
jgi:RNA polymerase sigma factor (sigma-70 family)